MQVSKWGNSLAVRLPTAVVRALGLKEGDQVEVLVKGERELEVSRDETRLEALERIRELQRPLPPGFKWNREELYERGSHLAGGSTEP
jgi:antitoxin MazE